MRVRAHIGLVASSVIGLALLAVDARAQICEGWTPLHDLMPRRNPVLVQTSSGPLLYGGTIAPSTTSNATLLATSTCETWRFDGTTWRFVTMDGPSPRYQAAGVYDTHRNTVVLFGGRGLRPGVNTEDTFRETWEFAQGVWTQRTVETSPVGRHRHAMVYDPSRQRTFLYGGFSLETIGNFEFWSYDGTNWSAVPQSTPNPGTQVDHALVADPVDNSIVLIPSGPAASAWRWNGTAWSQLAATGVATVTAFYDDARDAIVLGDAAGRYYTFAGTAAATAISEIATPLSGLTIYPTTLPLSDDRWLSVIAPPFTPTDEATPPSSLERVGTQWTPLDATLQPAATSQVALGFHPPSRESVLFGGSIGSSSTPRAQTWRLRGETWRQYVGAQPPPSRRAFLSYAPQRNAAILLGGVNLVDASLWQWTGASWSSAPEGNVPSSTFMPNPILDPASGSVLWPTPNGLITFNQGRSIDPLMGFSGWGEFDPARNAAVYTSTAGTVAQLLSTDSNSNPVWQPITITSPPKAEVGVAHAYSSAYGGIVAFGPASLFPGPDGPNPRKTYFLGSQASAWSQLPFATNGPTYRSTAVMVENPIASHVVMYGGTFNQSAYPLRETWKLARGPAAVALEPVNTFVIPGQTAELFIIASGGGVIDYQWFKDGQPLANSPRISGADADTLQIQGFTSDDDGAYHVTVRNPCGNDQSVAVQIRVIPVCPGDFDNSGGVDAADIAAFFSAYEQGLVNADVDLSGGVDASDIAAFFASYESGC